MPPADADPPHPAHQKPRGEDRRRNLQLDGPPYATKAGTVTEDRRTHIERRACWIHDFEVGGEATED